MSLEPSQKQQMKIRPRRLRKRNTPKPRKRKTRRGGPRRELQCSMWISLRMSFGRDVLGYCQTSQARYLKSLETTINLFDATKLPQRLCEDSKTPGLYKYGYICFNLSFVSSSSISQMNPPIPLLPPLVIISSVASVLCVPLLSLVW